MKTLTLTLAILVSFLFVNYASAQETITVTAIKANLRGTPSTSGIVVTTVNNGESFELIKEKAPWYLVQTPKYVGWIHGNSISLDNDFDKIAERYPEPARPKTTLKPVTGGDSLFESEYIGGDETSVLVVNQTDRLLTLNFGGVKYTVAAGKEYQIEIDGGRYEFSASVPRAYPTSGVEEFKTGYRYSWRFFIVKR